MKRLVAATIACAAILATVAGCAPSAVTLRTEHNGTSVTLEEGQTLEIALPSNPSTGYSWLVAAMPACLESAGESVFESEAAAGVVGAGGTETLTFTATQAGSGPLALEYKRSWETGVEPADTFTAEVTVKE